MAKTDCGEKDGNVSVGQTEQEQKEDHRLVVADTVALAICAIIIVPLVMILIAVVRAVVASTGSPFGSVCTNKLLAQRPSSPCT